MMETCQALSFSGITKEGQCGAFTQGGTVCMWDGISD